MSSFGGTVKLTGESEYKKALSEISSNLKVLNSEMKTVTSQYDKNDKSVENLSSQNDVLNKKIEEQEKKVSILKDALADSQKETGENSEKTKKWQIELNNAQTDLNKLNRELDTNVKTMAEAVEDTKEEADAVEDFGKEAEKSGGKALSLGDIIKANLISDAIKGGLSALAEGIMSIGSAMSESITAGAAYADTFLTMSVQTGISTENLQKYNAVAELVDVSTETMTKSMAKNLKSMTSASSGTGAMADAYKKLGVSVTNADGSLRDSETVYWETIDALKNITDETERDSVAMEILGKSAQELNPLIAQGSEGIKAMGDEAVKMGAVLSEDALAGLGAVDDEMQKFSSITSATSNILGSAFAPEIADVMMFTNDLGMSINGLLSTILSGGEVTDEMTETIMGAINDILVELYDVVDQILVILPELIGTIIQLLIDNLPNILECGADLLGQLIQGIASAIPQLIPCVMQVIEMLLNTIITNLPMIIEMGMEMLVSLIQGITDMMPTLIPTVIDAVILIAETLVDNIEMLIDAGIELILALSDGLIDALPQLIEKIPIIIKKLIVALTNKLPDIIKMGEKLVIELGGGLIKAIPDLLKKVPELIKTLVKGLEGGLGELKRIGKNLVEGLWNGIKDATGWVLDKIKGFGKDVLNGIKKIFGIHSPSTVFKEEVGKNLALGVGEGFADTMADVSADMQSAIPTEFDANISTNMNVASATSQMSTYDMMVSAFKQALTEVKVVMDDREMGGFVTNTIERVVFA